MRPNEFYHVISIPGANWHVLFNYVWGLFQLEKSLSPIDRKWLHVINLNFFVWRHESHRLLLKYLA